MLHLSLPDTVCPDSSSLHTDQTHSASLDVSYQNEEGSLSKMGTSDEPQLSKQDSKSQNNAVPSSVSTLFSLFCFIQSDKSLIPGTCFLSFL